MKKKLNQLLYLLKEDLGLFLSISFGVFMFVLFFQPFALERFDFNNRLIFVAGLGTIVFLSLVLVHALFPESAQPVSKSISEPDLTNYLAGFVLLAINTLAFTFYLKYVGGVSITFYNMFKIASICLVPPVVLRLFHVLRYLRQQHKMLNKEIKRLQNQFENVDETDLKKTITFISENSTEKFSLVRADLAMIRSANNYVEIVYKEEDQFKKKLIRNTMRNILLQIKQYAHFIRCHRTCIINILYVENLKLKYNNYWISIKGYQEQVPVSRQYLIQVKEAIPARSGE